jgi:alpha-L-fucosidase
MADSQELPERLKWWVEARFGMFIHWGLYAIPARGEWVMYQERIPKAEYARLAQKFKPIRYDADKWVALAQTAGMRYMVLTSRHHDGFSLFDSKVSDFTSVKTAAKRDLVGEYVDACR